MDVFKDVQEELIRAIKGAKGNICPKCHQGRIRPKVIEHLLVVVGIKLASSEIGCTVPAPGYTYRCPVCKTIYLMDKMGKYIRVPLTGKKVS